MDQAIWFAQQVKACEPGMYRLAMSILCNRDDAADAAQEAICIAYRKLDTLRSRERFRPWLLRILTNECYAIVRQRQRFTESDAIPEAETPGPESADTTVWQAVCELHEELRAVVVLYYYEGFHTREIAGILRISEENVRTRLSRARKRLKAMLEDADDEV